MNTWWKVLDVFRICISFLPHTDIVRNMRVSTVWQEYLLHDDVTWCWLMCRMVPRRFLSDPPHGEGYSVCRDLRDLVFSKHEPCVHSAVAASSTDHNQSLDRTVRRKGLGYWSCVGHNAKEARETIVYRLVPCLARSVMLRFHDECGSLYYAERVRVTFGVCDAPDPEGNTVKLSDIDSRVRWSEDGTSWQVGHKTVEWQDFSVERFVPAHYVKIELELFPTQEWTKRHYVVVSDGEVHGMPMERMQNALKQCIKI